MQRFHRLAGSIPARLKQTPPAAPGQNRPLPILPHSSHSVMHKALPILGIVGILDTLGQHIRDRDAMLSVMTQYFPSFRLSNFS
jgi:hypothetical protein